VRIRKLPFIIAGSGVWLVSLAGAADSPLEASAAAFNKWVEVQESISETRSEWAVEKEFLNEEIRLLSEEIAALEEKSGRLAGEIEQAEKDLAQFTNKVEVFKQAAGQVEVAVGDFEAGLWQLHPSLPEVLKEAIQPLMSRLPREEAPTNPGLGERMQAVVGVLSQVDKFNGALTVVPELRKSPEGKEVQVQTLYLGLAQAWFVGVDGSFAGHGIPTAAGWDWTPGAIAKQVKTAIDVQQNAGVAQFVDLPVTIK
jgi:hypothetical protein